MPRSSLARPSPRGLRGHEDYRPDPGILYLATFDAETRQLRSLELVPMRLERLRLGAATGDNREWISQTPTREGRRLGARVEADPHGHLALRW